MQRLLLPIVLIFCFCAHCVAAQVACCRTASIANAIASSINGQSINLANGTFSGSCDFSLAGLGRNITIRGSPLGTTIKCNSSYGFLLSGEGAGDLVCNLTLISNGTGVALSTTSGYATFSHVSFQKWNYAISGQSSNIDLTAVSFFNSSTQSINIACSNIVVKHGNFSDPTGKHATPIASNTTTMVTLDSDSTAVFISCQFTGNNIRNAIDSQGGLTIAGCAFTAARITQNTQQQTLISNSSFQGFSRSDVTLNGGALLSDGGGSVTIYNSLFASNTIFGDCCPTGGAFYINVGSGNTARVTNSTFVDNHSDISGGAVEFQGSGSITVSGSNFIRNSGRDGCVITIRNLNSALLTDLYITGGSGGNGGGIAILGCFPSNQLVIRNVVIRDSTAGTGGAICFSAQFNPTVQVIVDNVVAENVAGSHGAAVSIGDDNLASPIQITISNSQFINNHYRPDCPPVSGAAVYAYSVAGSMLTLINVTIRDTLAPEMNGIVRGDFAKMILRNVTCFNNSIKTGACASGIDIEVYDSYIANNFVPTNGAGLIIDNFGKLLVVNTVFENNTALQFGGAIAGGLEGSINSTGSTWIGNHAVSGAALYLSPINCATHISTGTFIGNVASDSGGGIYVGPAAFSTIQIIDSVFTENSAFFGGGIATESDTRVDNGTFVANQATGGAGLYSSNSVSVVGGRYSKNVASDSAGAVYCQACSIDLGGALLFDNNQSPDGPAFTCSSGSFPLQMSGSVQTSNNTLQSDPGNPFNDAFDCVNCGCCGHPGASTLATITTPNCVLSELRRCQYSCPTGYNVTAPLGLYCASGSLQPSVMCAPLPCPPLIPPPNGNVTGSIGAVTTNVAIITCLKGYDLRNGSTATSSSATCIAPKWIGVIPYCSRQACSDLGDPTNGQVSRHSGLFYLDVVTYSCSASFSVVGPTTRTCMGSDGWSPVEVPSCARVACEVLQPPANGTVSQPPGALTGDVATFTCDRGYYLDGANNITCLGNYWEPSPLCKPSPCANFTAVEFGAVSYSSQGNVALTGTVATFSCIAGYYVNGSATSMCVAPDWTSPAPTCNPVMCASPNDENYASASCPGDVAYQENCLVTCAAGTIGPVDPPFVTCIQPVLNENGVFDRLPTCGPCLQGTYSLANQAVCTPCSNAGRTPDIRSTSPSDCVCRAATYETPANSGTCVDCPVGATCEGASNPPRSLAGYYSTGQAQFAACNPATACTGNDTCAQGYTEFMCGSCASRYYRLNRLCYPCPNDGPWRIVVVVLVALVAVGLLFSIVRSGAATERTHGLVSINIGISFAQVIATFASLRINWPEGTKTFFDIFSSLNLNIEIASPECTITLSFYDKFQLMMLLPFIVAGLLVVIWIGFTVIMWIKKKRPPIAVMKVHAGEYAITCVASYLYFLCLAYLLLAQATFSVLACTKQPSGESTLNVSPNNSCDTAEWAHNAGFAVFGVIFYVIGIPLAVHLAYFRNLRRFGAFLAAQSLYSNFLVKKYRDPRWFWETIIMMRKLLIVIITVFFAGDSYLQLALCCVVSLSAFLADLILHPYQWNKHNGVEYVALMGELVVLFCGLLSANPKAGQTQRTFADTIACIAIVLVVLFIIACAATEIWITGRVKQLERKLNVSEINTVVLPKDQIVALLKYNGDMLIVSAKGTVLSWNLSNMMPARGFEVRHAITVAACRDGMLIIAEENVAEAWDIERQIPVGSYTATSRISHVTASALGLVIALQSGELVLFKLPSSGGAHKSRSDTLTSNPLFGSVRGDTSMLLDAFDDDETGDLGATAQLGSVKIMQSRRQSIAEAGNALETPTAIIPAHVGGVRALHAGSSFLYTAGVDGFVRKWNTKEASQLREWHLQDGVEVCSMEECDYRLFLGTQLGSVVVIDDASAQLRVVTSYRRHLGSVVRLTAAAGMIISGSANGSIILSDTKNYGYLQRLPIDGTRGITALFCTNAQRVFWSDESGALQHYEIKPQWHVRDHDPMLISRTADCVRACLGKKRIAAEQESLVKPDGSARAQIFNELTLLGEELELPDIPWESLLQPQQAAAVSAALTSEASQRQGKLARSGVAQEKTISP